MDDRFTMAPEPCLSITRISCFRLSSVPKTLVSKVAAKLSVDCSVIGPSWPSVPALLTATSRRPKCSTTCSTRLRTSDSWRTSARRYSARTPRARSSAARAWPASSRRPDTTTLAPSRAKASAVARPMPVRAPVISTTGVWAFIVGSSALSDDLTQHVERLVSRRKSRIGSYLEQCLTQLLHGPPEVQRAAQVRLELLVVSGGGEHRHDYQAAILQVQTGPIPHSTPDVLDGGLEKWRQKRIALCPRTLRFTKYTLTDRCAARPCVLCHLLPLVHGCFSLSGLRSPIYLALIGLSSPNWLPFDHGEGARTRNGEGTRDARADPASRCRAHRREGHCRHEPRRRPGTHRRQPQPALPLLRRPR